MSDEPHFPPPGGHLGYREAAPSMSDGDCSLDVVFRKRRVIATRPDDPDVAIAKAAHPVEPKPRRAVSSAIVIAILLVYITFIATCALLGPRGDMRSQMKSTPAAH